MAMLKNGDRQYAIDLMQIAMYRERNDGEKITGVDMEQIYSQAGAVRELFRDSEYSYLWDFLEKEKPFYFLNNK